MLNHLLLFLTFSLLSLSLHASTVDEEQFQLTASRQTYQAQLNAEKTHTEYREETRPETCYRQVYAGSVPECRWITEQICTRDYYGRVYCRPVTRQICYDRPIYRQEPYTCYRTVRVPYEVFDYFVIASANIQYSPAQGVDNHSSSSLKLRLEGDALDLSGHSLEGLLLFLNEKRETSRMEGNQKFIDAFYRVQATPKDQFTTPFIGGLRNLAIDQQGNITFKLGPIQNKNLLRVSLFVERRKLGKNPIVFNDTLAQSQWQVEATDQGSLVTIHAPALMQLQDKKKYTVSVKVEAPLDRSRLLNAADVGATQAASTLKFKF